MNFLFATAIVIALCFTTASNSAEITLVDSASPKCSSQRIFPITHVAFCNEKGGRSSLVAVSDAIIHNAPAGIVGSMIPGLPIKLPEEFRINFGLDKNGQLDLLSTCIMADKLKVCYNPAEDNLFAAYFNAMQFLVKKFTTPQCSIDGTTVPSFPNLDPIRGAMQALAVTFGVKDCTGGMV